MTDPVEEPAREIEPEAYNMAKQALLEPGSEIDPTAVEIVVFAAGGVVWRCTDDATVEVVLIHRPRYHDWTFPKGKRDPGETDKQCAVREVFEETGLIVKLGDELAGTGYIDRKGRPKQVRYWTMTVVDAVAFEPGDEVDEVVWVPVAQVKGLLTYPRDTAVLKSFRSWLDRRS